MPKVRLGYTTENLTLQKKGIRTGRTARMATIKAKGRKYALELSKSNFEGILEILKWNEAHGIKFYRITSAICPHITNPVFIKNKSDYKALGYSIKSLEPLMKQIGEYARKHGHRLTFHPDPFISLGTHSDAILLRNTRELWFHAMVLDIMGVDLNSIICIHGGGFYGNKPDTMLRWIRRFNAMPIKIKRRIALENDEFSYSIQDVLWISSQVKPYPVEFKKTWKPSKRFKIPIIFDIFHYYCYNKTVELRELAKQWDVERVIPPWLQSWGSRRPKMHISEQKKAKDAPRGAHAKYVWSIPTMFLEIPKKYGKNLDIMVEAKAKNLCLMKLKNKYGL